jgi:hypothetical protein
MASRRLPFAFAALLVVGVLAGCLDTRNPAPSSEGGAQPATPAQLAAAVNFTILLCTHGAQVAPNLSGHDECNHRVTKPLLDPKWFDVVDQHGPANEVSIAADPSNPLRVAAGAKDYTVSFVSDDKGCGAYTVWMGTYWSDDGGITWGNDLMPGFPGDTRASPLHGSDCNTDPVLVWDADGPLYYSGLNYGGARAGNHTVGDPLYPGSSDLTTASQIYFARSDDGGASYADFSFCATGDNGYQFNDKQWFAAQPGGDHMIVTWSPYYGDPPLPGAVPPQVSNPAAQSVSYISYCESMDGGATWSPQRFVNPGMAIPANSQFSMPAYLPGGKTIGLIWSADVTGTNLPIDQQAALGDQLAYTEGTITPAGTNFQPVLSTFTMHPIKAGPGRDGSGPSRFRMATYPVLAVDNSGGAHDGRRYVVWADQPGSIDTDIQVLLRWSDDGRNWSDPVTVNDDPAGDQFMPWIAVDPKGGVHVAWMDRRNDPTNRLLDVYYAYSDDGGLDFHPNVRLTEGSFDGDLGFHQTGAPFIGDYMGITATRDAAYVVWPDTRHTGEPTRATGSDVYTATILRDATAVGDFERPSSPAATSS